MNFMNSQVFSCKVINIFIFLIPVAIHVDMETKYGNKIHIDTETKYENKM